MLLCNTFKTSLELQLSILAVDYVHVMWVKTIICLNRTGRNSKILHRKSTRIITSNPFLWRTTCSRWICGRAKNSHGSCWWVRQIWQWSKGQTISAKFPSDCLGRILESCNWCLSPPRFQIKQNIFWWRNGKNQIYVFSFATISLIWLAPSCIAAPIKVCESRFLVTSFWFCLPALLFLCFLVSRLRCMLFIASLGCIK